jgi:G3E family GTPase
LPTGSCSARANLDDADVLTALQQRLQRINIRVPITPMPAGRPALTALFHLDAFRARRGAGAVARPSSTPTARPDCAAVAAAKRGFYRHDDDIASFVLQHPGDVDSALMAGFVEELLLRQGPALLRYKGVLALRGDKRKVVLQGVHRLSGSDYGAPWSEGEHRHTTLVLIGRRLDEEGIRRLSPGLPLVIPAPWHGLHFCRPARATFPANVSP